VRTVFVGKPRVEVELLDDEVDPRVAAVSLAVLRGARSVEEVRVACGWGSKSTAYEWLLAAVDEGLVSFEPIIEGTLRPEVELVASDLGR
jgi:hypothetical protein